MIINTPLNKMTLINNLKSKLYTDPHYDTELEIQNLEELIQFLNTFQIQQEFQTTFIHLNSPIQLTYIDDTGFNPICDEKLLTQKSHTIKEMIDYHIQEKLDFYCGLNEPNGNPENEIQMFGNYLIKKHFKLNKNEKIIISNPKIIMSSENEIAFPTIFDERTFTTENLEYDKNKFNY